MDARHRIALAASCLWLSLAAAPAQADLPPGVGSPPGNADRDKLSHLLASGMATAWNARAAAKPSQAPTVLIGDDFGNGKPPNLFSGRDYLDAKIVGGALTNPRNGSGDDHGYHVTGIVFGSFANDRTQPGVVTGAFPKRGKLVPIDRYEDHSLVNDTPKFAPAIEAVPGRVVVNTSIGYRDCVDTIARTEAVEWIEKVRDDLDLEDRVFHATAAGNEGATGGSARCGSDWSAAATRTDLEDTGGNPVDPLTNTLSVENVEEAANASGLGCLSPSSNTDGSIAAPGREVWSFTKNGGAKNKNGTSMSSPLVAGLAAYMWSIAPDLEAPQLSAAIRLNADAPASCTRTSARLLDAYAATLSLDQTGAPAPATWPVRFAMLDKNGDGKFDQKDLAAFRPEVKQSLLNTRRDWSRFDLNGDGFTGGTDTAPFDLDRSNSTRAGQTGLASATATIEGTGVTYEEEFVADADVLCFYAYSALYTGSPIKRKDLLTKLCGVDGTESNDFEGVARDCEIDPKEPDGKFCGDDGEAVGLLQESGTNFTFYIQPADDGSIDPATCATAGDPHNCFKATGTRSGNSFTGTAVREGGDPHPFEATLAGDELTGSFFVEDPGLEFAQFVEFELTRGS